MIAYFIGGPLDLTKQALPNNGPRIFYAPIFKGGTYPIRTLPDNLVELNPLKVAVYEVIYRPFNSHLSNIQLYIYTGDRE